jgi:hypothetical protein
MAQNGARVSDHALDCPDAAALWQHGNRATHPPPIAGAQNQTNWLFLAFLAFVAVKPTQVKSSN